MCSAVRCGTSARYFPLLDEHDLGVVGDARMQDRQASVARSFGFPWMQAVAAAMNSACVSGLIISVATT